MTQPQQRPVVRRITPEEFSSGQPQSQATTRRRTRVFDAPNGGSFSPSDLQIIIPPSNARQFKIIRPMGGRYVRGDNPEGLGTEGPFPMSNFPSAESGFSGFEELDVRKIIFDVSE